ncbi:MAG: flagellin FliC [Thermoleophilaceae bacterium]|nr:flagellin FliC [Thermoleophilaceae bacterium]
MRIQHNVEAMNAHRQLLGTSDQLSKSMQRLASGYRINSAADDAAGLAISEKLRSQIKGLSQAHRNLQDAISLVQTAEGSLSEVHAMLQRVRELAVQYKNGTVSADGQAAIQSEIDQLASEIERIGNTAQFNGISLLSGNVTITFQVGANDGEVVSIATQTLYGGAVDANTFALSVNGADISEIDAAIGNVNAMRAAYGAVQNRLEHMVNNVSVYEENITAAESRIRDVDMAQEMAEYTKLQILQQAGTAMLAQANQSSESVLSLLRG